MGNMDVEQESEESQVPNKKVVIRGRNKRMNNKKLVKVEAKKLPQISTSGGKIRGYVA